ncbi:MAG: IS66 family transposase [Verrucomicrobiota bacterium]
MAIALFGGGFYDARMTKELVLPNDLAACHAMIAKQQRVIDGQTDLLKEQKVEIAKLEKERDAALQFAFRKKIERYLADPKQFVIDFGDSPEVVDAAAGIADAAVESVGGYERRKPGTEKPRSEALPAHLPRYEVRLPVPADLKDCPTHGEGEVIGFDWRETLEIVPPKLIVRRTGIPKLACKNAPECGVVEADRPVGLIEGNKYDTSIAAEIIVDKYGYHIPIYRQQDLFASCGWTPSRGTLLNIQKSAAELIRPLVMHLREVVRAGPVMGTDDTTVTLITPQKMPDFDPGDPKSARAREVIAAALEPRRASVTARMWAYRSVTEPINLFDFTVSRHRDGPEIVLSGFEGTILADCYAGYESIELGSAGKIRRAACVAHARRKVFESRNNHPSHAALLLGLFQQLYDIEDRAKAFTPDDRRSLRQSESLPIWDEIGDYLASGAVANVMPKEPFGQAITYLRNNIEALRVHLDDGLVPIDNNDTEQLMKQLALGRKNWMFIGNIDAGNRAADLLSIVSSAARNDLDIFVYVKDVLDKLLGGSRDFEAMRPDVWKLAHPEAVRIYRQDERRHRAEVKSAKRAKRRGSRR